jgi:predicted nucleic acid-binding Zn ribbon protein|tara:strand:+ start:230 stop:505 length:276 start_codon:yes stop_codon:yes gene_type:complete
LKPINTVLNSFLKNNNLFSGVNQQKAVDLWPKVVGNKIAENTEAVSAERGVLFIKASSSTWSQELQLKKKDILLKINKELGKKTITDLRFV